MQVLWLLLLVICGYTEGSPAPVRVGLLGGNFQQDFMVDVASRYMADRPHVTVEVLPAPNDIDPFLSYIVSRLEKNDTRFDIFMLDVIWPGLIASQVRDISAIPILNAERPNFQPSIWNNNLVLEMGRLKTVAMPYYTDFGILYYRKDLVQKYFNTTRAPRTWDELEEWGLTILAGERRLQPSLQGYIFQGKKYESLTCNIAEWWGSHGAGDLIFHNRTVNMYTPAVIRATERIERMIANGLVPANIIDYSEAETHDGFSKGKAIFARNWPYQFNFNEGIWGGPSAVKGKWGAANLPGEKEGGGKGVLGGWSLAINKHGRDNEDAVADLMQWMTSSDQALHNQIVDGKLSTRSDARVTCNRTAEDGGVKPVICDVPLDNYIYARPSSPAGEDYPAVSSAINSNFHDMLAGKQTAREAVLEISCQTHIILHGAAGLPKRCYPKCAKGFFQVLETRGCAPCQTGHFSASEDQPACPACAPGTYQDTTAQSECKLCPVGTSQEGKGQDTCHNCGLQTYSSSNGTVKCTSCPAGTNNQVPSIIKAHTRDGFAAQFRPHDAKLCLPREGFYGPPGIEAKRCPFGGVCCTCPEEDGLACHVPSDKSDCNSTRLKELMRGSDRNCVECEAGSPYPLAKPGFYDFAIHEVTSGNETRRSSVPPTPLIIPCSPASACIGGNNCKEGSEGVRCSICLSGYYKDGNGACTSCPEVSAVRAVLTVVGLLVPLVLGLVFLFNASTLFRNSAVTVGIDWLQTLSVIASLQIEWPPEIRSMLTIGDFFNLSINFVPIACVFTRQWTFYDTWSFQLSLPLVLVAAVVCMHLAVKWLPIFRSSRRFRQMGDSNTLVNTICVALTVSYTIVTKAAFSIFRCTRPNNEIDIKFLVDAPHVECGTSEWNSFIPGAVFAVIFLGAGIPILVAYLLIKKRDTLHTTQAKFRFGALFAIYREEAFLWNVLLLSRKLILILVTAIIPEQTLTQACIALLLIFLSMILNGRWRPFKFDPTNELQFFLSLQACLTCIAAIIFWGKEFAEEQVPESNRPAWAIVLWLCFILAVLLLLRGFVAEFLSYQLWARADSEGTWRADLLNRILDSKLLQALLIGITQQHWALVLHHRSKFDQLPEAQRLSIFKDASQVCPTLGEAMLRDELHKLPQSEVFHHCLATRLKPISKLWAMQNPAHAAHLSFRLSKLLTFWRDSRVSQVYNSRMEKQVVALGGPSSPIVRDRSTGTISPRPKSNVDLGELLVQTGTGTCPSGMGTPSATDSPAHSDPPTLKLELPQKRTRENNNGAHTSNSTAATGTALEYPSQVLAVSRVPSRNATPPRMVVPPRSSSDLSAAPLGLTLASPSSPRLETDYSRDSVVLVPVASTHTLGDIRTQPVSPSGAVFM